MSFDDVLKAVGLTRPTFYRARKNAAGFETVKAVNEYLDSIGATDYDTITTAAAVATESILGEGKGVGHNVVHNAEQGSRMERWSEVGERLLELLRFDVGRFDEILDGLLKLIESIELQEDALRKLRGVPPSEPER